MQQTLERRCFASESAKARILHLVPKEIQRTSPGPDLVLTIDKNTKEYTTYKEYTPGCLLVAPCDLLGYRMGDVAPAVAEVLERAIWETEKAGAPVEVNYTFRDFNRLGSVFTRGDLAHINIKALGAARALRIG